MVRKVFYEDDLAVSVVDASKGIKFYRKLRFVSQEVLICSNLEQMALM